MGGPALIDGEHVEGTDNFLIAPFVIDGLTHQSCEHYFQWAKFASAIDAYSVQHCEAIRQCPTGGKVWQMGQSRRATMRPDWEVVKANVMYRAVSAKMEQHPKLAAELAATSGAIRAAPSTADWQHVNGLILERVREECRPPESRGDPKRYAALVALTEPPVPLVVDGRELRIGC
uniref:NADAR domain-containing protein n=1 Tax=Prymnesium polylepis TaxID=72548 RepID=A0A6T8CYN1_9EUKA|mmetsp:Transcript_36422/g.100526  ORF Transcript_36422/g.100526 Transcript_36422/m.100526 type:complete len:175 (+) Transcript_36422:123-647(+)|eukprot:7026113-Prymnesium_polylepis.1